MMKIITRESDGRLFRASCADNYEAGNAMADVMSGRASYYFRGITKRKYWFGYKDTGEIWQPEDEKGWSVTDGKA